MSDEKEIENVLVSNVVDVTKELEDDKLRGQQIAYLQSKENQDGALNLASAFIDFMGTRKWFTVEQLCKKTKMDKLQATQKLQQLKLFGFAQVRLGYWKDDVSLNRRPLWKVFISVDAKLSALDGVIKYYQDQIEDLELQKKSLLMEAEKQSKNSVQN